jgi:hypothetical protein
MGSVRKMIRLKTTRLQKNDLGNRSCPTWTTRSFPLIRCLLASEGSFETSKWGKNINFLQSYFLRHFLILEVFVNTVVEFTFLQKWWRAFCGRK